MPNAGVWEVVIFDDGDARNECRRYWVHLLHRPSDLEIGGYVLRFRTYPAILNEVVRDDFDLPGAGSLYHDLLPPLFQTWWQEGCGAVCASGSLIQLLGPTSLMGSRPAVALRRSQRQRGAIRG